MLFRAVIFILIATSAFAQKAAPPKPAAFTDYNTEKLGDGLYAFISPESNGSMVTGNSLLVIGDDSALVVDSGHFPSLTARMIAEIKRLTPKPVRWLVNTHWHPDHNAGNGLYLREFPGIQIVSTEATRDAVINIRPKKEVSMDVIDRYAAAHKRGTYRDTTTPFSPEDKASVAKTHYELEAFRPELQAAEPVAPTTAFKDYLSIYLGKREVRLLFLGRGNTEGDAVVYVPDAKLLATGDLVVYPVPYPFGSFIGEWPATLKKLVALDATTIIPGHGPVMRDKSYIALTIELLESITAQVNAAYKAGVSQEDALKKVDVAELRKKFVADSPERAQFFDNGTMPVAITRAYREAKEGPLKDQD